MCHHRWLQIPAQLSRICFPAAPAEDLDAPTRRQAPAPRAHSELAIARDALQQRGGSSLAAARLTLCRDEEPVLVWASNPVALANLARECLVLRGLDYWLPLSAAPLLLVVLQPMLR